MESCNRICPRDTRPRSVSGEDRDGGDLLRWTGDWEQSDNNEQESHRRREAIQARSAPSLGALVGEQVIGGSGAGGGRASQMERRAMAALPPPPRLPGHMAGGAARKGSRLTAMGKAGRREWTGSARLAGRCWVRQRCRGCHVGRLQLVGGGGRGEWPGALLVQTAARLDRTRLRRVGPRWAPT